MRIELGLLGDTYVRVGNRGIDVGPSRQRCVLAVLLISANHPVSLAQLVDRVWGEEPPQRAAGTLRSYLSRLRHALSTADDCDIQRGPAGYLLKVDEAAVDLHRFRALSTQARVHDGATEAADLYGRALALWRGEAFADVESPWITAMRHTLHAERTAARLDYYEVRLRLGRHAALIPELLAFAAEHPLDERLAGQLLLALYRSGRQGEALQRYEEIRLRLADELGADPSAALQELHQQILVTDPAIAGPAKPASIARSVWSAPRQLPAPPPLFVGRSRELAALDAALNTRREAEKTLVISTIGGSGGTGKTWLALHWAHENIDKFPDGQLYANLRGFDPSDSPMPPEAAIRIFLEALGVDSATIPPHLDAQTAAYRSLLADRRMLVVLDNARDTAQVVPLLPGGSACTVVVTSRHRLTGLVVNYGAHPVALSTLTAAEGHQLLSRRLGAQRAATDPAAVTDLLGHCGGLPLALGIVAARAAMNPALALADLAEELHKDATRLDALDAGEVTASLRATFSSSHQALLPPAARLFRLLGMHPGPDIALSAVASLAGITVDRVRPLLSELAGTHLVTEHTPGRFALHDLLRAYAAELARTAGSEAEGRAALRRALDHYLHTAHTAVVLCYPHWHAISLSAPSEGVTPVALTDRREAIAWITAESPVLLAAVQRAADDGFPTHVWQLACTLTEFLDRQGHWHDHIVVQRLALTTAAHTADRLGEANAHRGLARAYARLGHYDEAVAHFHDALDLFAELGDTASQARTHDGLGWLMTLQGRHRDALAHDERSRELHEAVGDRTGLAMALNAIGWSHTLLGDHRVAIDHCRQALALHEELGQLQARAATWDSLAHAHAHLGDHAQAITCHEHALSLFREVGDRYKETDSLIRLGETHDAAGETEAARRAWQYAMDILNHHGHPNADQVRAKLREALEASRN